MKREKDYQINHSIKASFVSAVSGVVHALRSERNLRIHFAAAAYVLYFSRYYEFSGLEYSVIMLLIGMVITCEMLNTAVERTVDLETSQFHRLAKIAKDTAAGAVLVSSILSAAAGVLLFWDVEVFAVISQDLRDQIIIWILLAAITWMWVIGPKKKR